jgi:hypothetical protein
VLAILQLRIFYHLTCHVRPKIKLYTRTILYKGEKSHLLCEGKMGTKDVHDCMEC